MFLEETDDPDNDTACYDRAYISVSDRVREVFPDRTDMEVAEHAEEHVEAGFEIHCIEEKLTDKDDDPGLQDPECLEP